MSASPQLVAAHKEPTGNRELDKFDKWLEPHVTVYDQLAFELATNPRLLDAMVHDLWRDALTEAERQAVIDALGVSDEDDCCKELKKAMLHVIAYHRRPAA